MVLWGFGVGWWVGSYSLSSQAPTHVEVELGCDNLLRVADSQVQAASQHNEGELIKVEITSS